jgi:PilZ domain
VFPNRRRKGHPRFPVRVPAATERSDSGETPKLGEAQDLSRGGMLLRLDHAMVPGSPVRVTLHLSHRFPLTFVGKVVWSQRHPDLPGWAIGIEFGEVVSGEMVAEIADEEQPSWGRTPREDATPPMPPTATETEGGSKP